MSAARLFDLGYAVLVRHPGWIDRFAHRVPVPRFGRGEESIDAWLADGPPGPAEQFGPDEGHLAEAHAAALAGRFAADGYRFSVVAKRAVPRWFLARPTALDSRSPVGDYDQI